MLNLLQLPAPHLEKGIVGKIYKSEKGVFWVKKNQICGYNENFIITLNVDISSVLFIEDGIIVGDKKGKCYLVRENKVKHGFVYLDGAVESLIIRDGILYVSGGKSNKCVVHIDVKDFISE